MAKFCGNCGMQLDDSARVCGNCGTPLESTAVNTLVITAVKSEKKKKMRKKVKRVLGLLIGLSVLVFVAITTLKIVKNYTGTNGVVRKAMSAYMDYDILELVDLSSDMYYYTEDEYDEKYFRNVVGRAFDDFEVYVGRNYKLTYEIKDTYELSNRNIETMLTRIEESYPNFDVSIIEKVVTAEISITAEGGKKTYVRDVEITMSKEDGEWKILYIE